MSNNDITIRILAKDQASSVLTGAVAGITASITNLGISILQSGIQKLGEFLGDSSQAALEFEKSMTTLSIIAPRFGVNIEDAKNAAQLLGKELRIGVGPAAEALQNLLKGGLNLDQSTELMKRFTNEAMTGKSSSISLADAVKNLSFAYTTNNSALGNLSGISENFSDITEKGRAALIKEGVAVANITDDMAKFRGIMDLTNLTLGSSEQFTGKLADTQAELGLRFDDLKVRVGSFINPLINDFLKLLIRVGEEIGNNIVPIIQNTIIPVLSDLAESFKPIIQIGIDIFNMFAEYLAPFFEELGRFAGEVLPPLLSYLGDRIKEIGPTFEFIWGIIKPILELFLSLVDFTFSGIRYIWDTVLKPALDQLAAFWETTLRPAMEPVFKFIGDSFTWLNDNVIQPFLRIINEVTDKINELTGKTPKTGSAVFGRALARTMGPTDPGFATGADFITNGPMRMVVGDNSGGKERVQVTPIGSPNVNGPQGRNITINNNFMDSSNEASIVNRLAFQLKSLT